MGMNMVGALKSSAENSSRLYKNRAITQGDRGYSTDFNKFLVDRIAARF